jgi:hypothetical protein
MISMIKRLALLVIAVIATIFAIIFLSESGIQTISTDKSIYSRGETVRMTANDFALEWCSCNSRQIQIFRQGGTGWELVNNSINGLGGACVDGNVAPIAMPCDFVVCSFPRPNSDSRALTWNLKIYEASGMVESCYNSDSNETINGTFHSYTSKDVSPGRYKIQYGIGETLIQVG